MLNTKIKICFILCLLNDFLVPSSPSHTSLRERELEPQREKIYTRRASRIQIKYNKLSLVCLHTPLSGCVLWIHFFFGEQQTISGRYILSKLIFIRLLCVFFCLTLLFLLLLRLMRKFQYFFFLSSIRFSSSPSTFWLVCGSFLRS